MNETTQSLLEAAREVAGLTGEVALRHFRTALEVDTKADGSPVTRADREAEQAARAWLAARFPGDGVAGEEFGESNPGAARRWFLDPVDGTKSFVRGVPLWGTMVGVLEAGVVVAGAVAFPALEEEIAAARGAGCWWNGARCRVSAESDLARATVLATDERFGCDPRKKAAWEALAARASVARSWGDCYGYLLVATGRAELMTDGVLHPWDAVPLVPIVEEAGGVLTDWNGGPAGFGVGAIATNAALAGPARALLFGAAGGEGA
jgi:histidinol phosphatase-like enzyme (inositol monophosphatase family)